MAGWLDNLSATSILVTALTMAAAGTATGTAATGKSGPAPAQSDDVREGANAPGGAYNYVINGNMIAGFALIAWPANYGQSGIMTFECSHHGQLLQKDLGPDTATIAAATITRYDPDSTWRPADRRRAPRAGRERCLTPGPVR